MGSQDLGRFRERCKVSRMLHLLFAVACLFAAGGVQGRSKGAPMCTLGPRHGGYGSSGSWKDMVDVKIIPLNQNKLLDYKNKEKPNGNLVILKAKKQFKGIACQVMEPHRYGHEAVQLPMMHRNTKLKKLDCGTKGPFFFKYNTDYVEKKRKWFKCTLVVNYGEYYTDVVF